MPTSVCKHILRMVTICAYQAGILNFKIWHICRLVKAAKTWAHYVKMRAIFIGLSSHFFHRKKWVHHFSILHYNLLLNNTKYWYICPVVLQNSTIQDLQYISYYLMLPEFFPDEQVSSTTIMSYKKGLWVVNGRP